MEREHDGSAPSRDLGGRGAAASDAAGGGSIQPDPSTAPPSPEPSSLVDELFSILSHELRAPLTTIKGSSRTLLRHGAALQPETARQLLRDIDQEADRLHRLVDNLLELARAGVGPSALRTEPTALDVLLRRVVADATPRAGNRRLRVRAPVDLPQPAIDPVRIEQVVRNLVDNAVKFSPATGTIDISAARQGGAIVVMVKDDGPGVAPEYHDRVFERFFRVEREGSNVAGAGLGLAICKRFVELHGGRIELESRPGQGAAFRFTLPLGEQNSVSESSTVSASVSESAP
jgi:two-component system, OmpR family, sensor histidine kinase KdpD